MRKSESWTKEDISELTELRVRRKSLKEISVIMGRSIGSIRNKIYTLRLPRLDYADYSEEEKEYIRLNYKFTQASKQEIANHLGRTFCSITRMVSILGLQRWYRREWTTEDDEFLRENVGKLTPATIAKYKGRSVNAVISRIRYLKLHRRSRHGWYTSSEAAEILGCSSVHVRKRYIDSGKLKAVSRYDGEKNIMWEIKEASLKDFITRYPHELTGRICDIVQIVNILSNGIKYKTGEDGCKTC